jgi:hypothetical protein
MASLWVGRFQKDTTRPTDSNIGTAYADWEVEGEVIYTYSQRVDGVGDKNEFKAAAIAGRDKYLADEARNVTLGNQLTTFLNQ